MTVVSTPVTNFRLPVELRERVRSLAAERGLTLTDAVVEALLLWERRELRRSQRSSPPADTPPQ